MTPATVVEALQRAASLHRPGAGLRFLDIRERETFYSWATIYDRARNAAAALQHAGVNQGDRVSIILPTGIAFFDAFFGAQLLGAIPVPHYPPVRLGRLDAYTERTTSMIHAVGSTALVTDTRVGRVLGEVANQCSLPVGVLHCATLQQTEAPSGMRLPEVTETDLGLIQFSSGTTRAPKPAALSHRALLANAACITQSILQVCPLDAEPPPGGVSWLPLYHDMGLIGCVFPSLLGPGPLTLIPPEVFLARPAIWLRALSTYRATISPAPNFAWALCTERVRDTDLEGVDLSHWMMALNGAEPVSVSTVEAFTQRFSPWGFSPHAVMPVYGLSEAALAITFTAPGDGLRTTRVCPDALGAGRLVPHDSPTARTLVSVGTPLPAFEVRIVDPEAYTDLPVGHVGLILVRGPSLMDGYFGRKTQPFIDGWLDTGDLGALFEQHLYLVSRQKDLIILRGRNFAPQDLEEPLHRVEGLRTGCHAAVAHIDESGEQFIIFSEVRTPSEGLTDAVMNAIMTAHGIRPDHVILLSPGTLPRTSSGKIRRGETLKRWLANELHPPDHVTAWSLTGAMAKSAAAYASRWWRTPSPESTST